MCCEGCGANLNDVNGTFASSNYPGSVTTEFTCRWMIRVPARRSINLRLTVMPSLSSPSSPGSTGTTGRPDAGCRTSYVQVLVRDPLIVGMLRPLGRYCTAVSQTHSLRYYSLHIQ